MMSAARKSLLRTVLLVIPLIGAGVRPCRAMLIETFEGSVPPDGWTTFQTGDGSALWTRSLRAAVGWGYSAYSRRENLPVGQAVRRWLVTPLLAADSAEHSVTFWVRTQYPAVGGDDTLSVLISRSGSDPENFLDTLAALTPGPDRDFNDHFQRFVLDIGGPAESVVYVAFVHVDWGSGDNQIFLDSVAVPDRAYLPEPPSQPQPADSSVGVSVTTSLTWIVGLATQSADLYFSRTLSEVEQTSPTARVLSETTAQTYQPSSHLLSNETYYWRVVARNEAGETLGPVWRFATGEGPLGGQYHVGGANADFLSLGEALTALTGDGVSEATTLFIAPGTYAGSITLLPVPGASESAPVLLRPADSSHTVTLTSAAASDTTVVAFAGASFITLDGLDVLSGAANVRCCVTLTGGSGHNTVRNARLRGPGSNISNSYAIWARASGCDDNRFENLTVRRAWRGIYIESTAGSVAEGNSVESCHVDSVRSGISLIRQDGGRVHGNEIVLNGAATDEADAVLVGTTLPGDTITISGNRIHGIATSGSYAVGVRVRSDSASAVVRVFNNFIYGFQNTGTTQVRAIYVSSGWAEIVANSICVNNVAATGTAYAVYIGTIGAAGSTHLRNNLFVNREATAIAYNVFVLSTTAAFESDYNIFHGTGTSYRLGRFGGDWATLALWKQGTGMDGHSLEGDPGFMSDNDLHISFENGLAHQNGAIISYLTEDIDGDVRLIPPDRGADEYTFDAPAAEFCVFGFVDLAEAYPESSAVTVQVLVQNRGSEMQSEVPVRLFYQDQLQSEIAVTLPPLTSDTMTLPWNTGGESAGMLAARCFLPNDAYPDNDSVNAWVSVIPPPLSGTYHIGGSAADYPSFSAAVNDLHLRGVAGAVFFLVEPGVYSEQIVLPPIRGASPANRIAFLPTRSDSAVTVTSTVGPATVVLSGADYLMLADLDIAAVYPNIVAIQISQDGDSNEITGGLLTGPSYQLTTACGVRITGGGNDGNVLNAVTVGGFYYGIRLEGLPGLPDRGNRVEGCTVLGARTGVRVDYQDGAVVRSNEVRTGYDGAAAWCCGIHLNSLSAGAAVRVDANLLTGGRGAAGLCGIYSVTGSGTARIQNNMICNWSASGSAACQGILVGNGNAALLFNSLWMNDIAGTGDVIAVSDTGSTTSLTLFNNAIQVGEAQNRACAVEHAGASFAGDFNAFSDRTSGNPQYSLGQWHGTNAPTLADWQTMSGGDLHSLCGDPGFQDSTNLHVRPTADLLDGRGQTIADVTTDFDGDPRGNPPDIGADEYTYTIYTDNCAVEWLPPPATYYSSATPYDLGVRVINYGSADHDSIPVQLSFDGSIVDEVSLNLAGGQADTITLHWLTPETGLHDGVLKAQSLLPGDEVAADDSVTAMVTVVGPPLSGDYSVAGDSADFSSFSESARHLALRGVSGAVTMNVNPGLYNEAVCLSEIAGTDSLHPVIFRAANGLPGSVLVTAASGDAVMKLDGADNLIFENLTVAATSACTTATLLLNGACNNSWRNCTLRGADSSVSWTAGWSVRADGNNGNRLDGVTVCGAFTGVNFEASPPDGQSSDNAVRHCAILQARYGIYAGRQINAEISGCDIQPGSLSSVTAACYGIYVASLGSGGSVQIIGNRIHGFADSSSSVTNRAVGIFAAAAAGASVTAYNNFVYGFQAVRGLKIDAIYLSAGDNQIYHNSVLIDDVSSTNEIACIYISTGISHSVTNNILMSLASQTTSYGILQLGGSGLVSDGNDIYGPSPAFRVGRIGSNTFSTLDAWQAAGYDANGISADPVFVSSSDLHIADTAAVVDGRGVPLASVTVDIDGEPRGNPPDIGADEYTVHAVTNPPPGLTAYALDCCVRLMWRRSPGATVYHVYADSSVDVRVDPESRIATTADTTWLDPIQGNPAARRFYVVTADSAPPTAAPASPDPDAEGTRRR